MSNPWTLTRLVRWRVKDWASCFLASRFHLDDEADRYCCISTPTQMPLTTNIAPFSKNKKGSKNPNPSSSMSRRSRNSDQDERPRNPRVTTDDIDHSTRSPFQEEDEDYIVFCFKEDGALDVIKNGNSSQVFNNPTDLLSGTARPLSTRKYEEGLVKDIHLETESSMGENRVTNQSEMINDRRIMVSTESSDSNHSDVSSGSFAFPVLGWEWSGSPVQMPKSEGLKLRKHKARCVGFQCCRF